jgi:hypothetical protein
MYMIELSVSMSQATLSHSSSQLSVKSVGEILLLYLRQSTCAHFRLRPVI